MPYTTCKQASTSVGACSVSISGMAKCEEDLVSDFRFSSLVFSSGRERLLMPANPAQVFPETCLFTDVFGLVEDEPGRAELLDPQQVTWKQTCYCETHKRQCPVVFPRDTLLCLGAPCVLFSKLLASKGFA